MLIDLSRFLLYFHKSDILTFYFHSLYFKATVRKDKFTGKSRGFGFVTFDNPDDASAAIDGMNGKMLDGRPITVGYARKESRDGGGQYGGGGGGGGGRRSDGDPYKLYIGGLHEETDEDILEKEASKYGKVEDVFLIKDRVSQQSRGFAFVKYESSEDASMAKEALDGKDFDGGTLIVQHARKSRPGGGGRGDYGGGDRYGGRDNRRDGGYGGRSYGGGGGGSYGGGFGGGSSYGRGSGGYGGGRSGGYGGGGGSRSYDRDSRSSYRY